MADDGVKIKVSEPDALDEPIEEFDNVGRAAGRAIGGVGNLLGQVVRLQFGLVSLPLNLLPAKSRYHAKNSVREGFLAIKTLVDDVTNGIDSGLSRALERDRVRSGAD
jgi:hypothetical protein